jgi:hypothetical protein
MLPHRRSSLPSRSRECKLPKPPTLRAFCLRRGLQGPGGAPRRLVMKGIPPLKPKGGAPAKAKSRSLTHIRKRRGWVRDDSETIKSQQDAALKTAALHLHLKSGPTSGSPLCWPPRTGGRRRRTGARWKRSMRCACLARAMCRSVTPIRKLRRLRCCAAR